MQIVSRGPATAAIAVTGIEKGSASESWVLTLHASARGFELNITGTMTADALAGTIVHHSLLATPLAVYGYYPDDGVVQMMNAKKGKNFMPSARPLQRVYMMGGVNPSNTNPKPPDSTQGAIDITRSSSFPGQVTMLSSNPDSLLGRLEHVATGFFEVVAGNMTGGLDAWGKGLSGPDTTDAAATTIVAGTSWKSSMIISPNNKNFPASNLTIGSNIPTDDLNAVCCTYPLPSPTESPLVLRPTMSDAFECLRRLLELPQFTALASSRLPRYGSCLSFVCINLAGTTFR